MNVDRDWQLFVDGEFVPGSTLRPVVDPATGEICAEAPDGTEADIKDAVCAARDSLSEWRSRSPRERGSVLFDVADVLADHADELAILETIENGKPLSQSEQDVSGAVKYTRFYGGAADKFYGEAVRDSVEAASRTVREPYGVVGVVIPWNWPPLHTMQFASAALATGNTVVLKPSPETPLSSLRIAELVGELLPDGVFNVVPGGVESGQALVSHEGVDKLAFTGNDETGERVLASAAKNITPAMLELGGKNAEIVFPDADLEDAVAGAVRNAFYNSGQACSDTERLLLHVDVYDEFLEAFAPKVESLTVDAGRKDPDVGPLTSEAQQKKVQSYVDTGERNGIRVVASATTPDDPDLDGGYWVPPTVFEGVDPDHQLANEEIFGPVVSVIPFESEREAIEIANGVDFGLTAAVWTTDLERAHRLVAELEVGAVSVNGRMAGGHALPFGGYKRSGIGRKSDFEETMREFTRVKSVHMAFGRSDLSL